MIKKEGKLGFTQLAVSSNEDDETKYKDVSTTLTEELKKRFKVEFLNRVDSTLVFRPLNPEVARKIARLLVKEVKERLKSQRIKLDVTEKVYNYLSEKGFSPEYGAREIRRLIQDEIEIPLSEKILAGSVKTGQKVSLSVLDSQISFQ